MAENSFSDLTGERIKEAASDTVSQGTDIRARVRELTLLALQRQRFDRHGMREVVRAVTEGIALGAEQSRADMRQSTADALQGLDQALRTSAEAAHAALKQLATAGKDFSDSELKQALASLRKLEDDFLSTVGHVTDAASERVQPALREALSTARHTGTETGKQVALALGDFAQKFSAASVDAAIVGLGVASEFGQRFALVASGILSGLTEALRAPRPQTKDKPKER